MQKVVGRGVSEWPEDDGTLEVEDVCAFMRRAFKSAYTFRRRRGDIEYEGPGYPIAVPMSPPPAEALSAAGLSHAWENGRDALDELILVTFLLGCEQGARIQRERWKPVKEYLLREEKESEA